MPRPTLPWSTCPPQGEPVLSGWEQELSQVNRCPPFAPLK